MNYRHAYHAGNFADVMKHAVLALVIEHLARKPTPFRVIDTHAGIGRYDLTGAEASRTGEWRDGIGRLLGVDALPLPISVRPLLAAYLETVRSLNLTGDLAHYPGSPLVALGLMREQDRLIANELHPADNAILTAVLGRERRAKALRLDGWTALRAQLPPKERRGLILIDPPYEEASDFDRLVAGLAQAVQRFATGTYMLWFPIKDQRAVAGLERSLRRSGLTNLLWAEMRVRSMDGERLAGSGLAILNPPFTLADQLAGLLPYLTQRLSQDAGSAFRLVPPEIA